MARRGGALGSVSWRQPLARSCDHACNDRRCRVAGVACDVGTWRVAPGAHAQHRARNRFCTDRDGFSCSAVSKSDCSYRTLGLFLYPGDGEYRNSYSSEDTERQRGLALGCDAAAVAEPRACSPYATRRLQRAGLQRSHASTARGTVQAQLRVPRPRSTRSRKTGYSTVPVRHTGHASYRLGSNVLGSRMRRIDRTRSPGPPPPPAARMKVDT